MTDLGTLGGQGNGVPMGINECGQVVGWDDRFGEAVLWEPSGLIIALGTPGKRDSRALEINEHGQIVGWGAITSDDYHAFLWQIGTE